MAELKEKGIEELCEWLDEQLDQDEKEQAFAVIRAQKIKGKHFITCTREDWRSVGLPLGIAMTLVHIAGKKKESFAFRYKDPELFCDTFGSQWMYQADDSWKPIFDKEITAHYENWKAGKHQKIQHPLFLCLSGPGTGKSRLLDEFQNMLCDSVQNNEIAEMMRRALVFNISFENGTSGDPEPFVSDYAIGGRMMYQMREVEIGWKQLALTKYYRSLPEDIISSVCKEKNLQVRDTCVFLLIDGLQMLEHEDRSSKHTQMYSLITSVCNLINRSNSFVIACCTSTVFEPVTSAIAKSPQRRIYLTPPSLNPEKIFPFLDEPVLKLLMHDMGGHGRALEAFSKAVNSVDITNTSLSSLGKKIVDTLVEYYPEIVTRISTLDTALKVVLSRRKVNRDECVSGFYIDDIEALGLFTYDESSRMLNCAFVALSLASRAGVLPELNIGSYSELDHNRQPDNFALGLQCWQHWEEFNCRFRCLKSDCIQGSVLFTDIHAGAYFGDGCSVLVESRKLSFQRLYHHRLTKSETKDDLSLEPEKFFKSAEGNPSGDAFCILKMKSGEFVNEVHQYKHVKSPVTSDSFADEYEKAASKDTDFFVYFTTSEASDDVQIPFRCALVDKSCWKDYFGPYWARGFYLKVQDPPNINDCSFFHLTSVRGVGDSRGRLIQRKRPYDGADQAYEVLEKKVPKSVLKRFRYN
jgi:hypothetical protein